MRALRLSIAALTPILLLSACATEPLGPTIPVMPAPNKPFDMFQGDQALCKQYASNEVQGGAQQANNRQVGTAVIGTLLGAGLGAAIGGGKVRRSAPGPVRWEAPLSGRGQRKVLGQLQQRYNLVLRAVHVFPWQPGPWLCARWRAPAASAAGLCSPWRATTAWLCAGLSPAPRSINANDPRPHHDSV